jgi:hypothetical protein
MMLVGCRAIVMGVPLKQHNLAVESDTTTHMSTHPLRIDMLVYAEGRYHRRCRMRNTGVVAANRVLISASGMEEKA